MSMFSKIFGTHSQREVKRILPLVDKIDSLRPEMQKLTDEELRDKTREYKERSCQACTGYGALQGTADRWYYPASGTYC